MPILPRGEVKRRRPLPRLLLGCPRICPEYELGALRALIKPQYKGAILHRKPEQRWEAHMEGIVREAACIVAERLGWLAQLHFPVAGDYHFIIDVPAAEFDSAKALAILLTKRLDGIWLTLGKYYVRRGKFFKRHRSHNILLTAASSIHLSRAARSALKGEI